MGLRIQKSVGAHLWRDFLRVLLSLEVNRMVLELKIQIAAGLHLWDWCDAEDGLG